MAERENWRAKRPSRERVEAATVVLDPPDSFCDVRSSIMDDDPFLPGNVFRSIYPSACYRPASFPQWHAPTKIGDPVLARHLHALVMLQRVAIVEWIWMASG